MEIYVFIVKGYDSNGVCHFYGRYDDEVDYNSAIAYCKKRGWTVEYYMEFA